MWEASQREGLINSLHPNISMQFLHTFPFYISYGACKENFSKNQGLKFLIITLILMNLMFDLGVILLGEITCLSLLGVKGLLREELIREMAYERETL